MKETKYPYAKFEPQVSSSSFFFFAFSSHSWPLIQESIMLGQASPVAHL